jgi:hypothetical protein
VPEISKVSKGELRAASQAVTDAAMYCYAAFNKVYNNIVSPQDFMKAFFYGIVDGVLESGIPTGYKPLNSEILDKVVGKHQKLLKNEVNASEKPSEMVERVNAQLRGAMGKALRGVFKLGKGLGRMCHKVADGEETGREKSILGYLTVNLTTMAAYTHYMLSSMERISTSAVSTVVSAVKMTMYGLVDGIHGSMEHDPSKSSQILDEEAATKVDKILNRQKATGSFDSIGNQLRRAYSMQKQEIQDMDNQLTREGGDLAKAMYDERIKSWDVSRFVARKYSGSENSFRKKFIKWYDDLISKVAAVQDVTAAHVYNAAKLTGAWIAGTIREKTKATEVNTAEVGLVR